WYNGNVVIHFTCTDEIGGSGIASCPADQTLTASGTSTAGTATDNAGNVSAASNTVTVQIDKVKPTISAAATTSPNAAGWYNGNVVIHFTCADADSGLAVGSCPADQTLSASGTSTAATVTDKAGNTSDPSNTATVQIDK